ncbi:uncharacterized protein C12orf56 homolog [Hippoglossus stenolepis]|uniref:uncharacterized protein C12orf56 homolog n=1 Tax=Hippoglossus stenolepis TaxID=195615 RepID=UPI001FAEC337|nr:uncharacterized protein C12orf56 homolog [Hippoglossus stenolepis]
MSLSGSGSLISRRNIKLDSFLQRSMERAVHERVRASEPCVVVSDAFNKVYMHAVLSDERVYLTEHAPRTLTVAVSFRRVRGIEMVNDLPEFLSGRDRDHCQHIRILYVTDEPATRAFDWLRRDKGAGLPLVAPPSRRSSHCPTITHNLEGGYPAERNHSDRRTEEVRMLKPSRSASCPNPDTLGLLRVPHPPTQPPLHPPTTSSSPSERSLKTLQSRQVPRRMGSVLSRLLRRGCVGGGEQREAELHLYAVSQTSRLHLHLQSAWSSFIIRSTLLLDPLYRRKCSSSSDSTPGKRPPVISWERTAHLFAQLTSELLQDGIDEESLYLLLQELNVAAQRNVALRRLFWRSSELCVFLVQTLEESLHGRQSLSGVYTADQLLLSTVVVETLAVMFRETQAEAARLNLLSARKGALTSRILLALICDPLTQGRAFLMDSEIQVLLSEYLDAACSLLFELLLLGHEATSAPVYTKCLRSSGCFSADALLSVDWLLRVVQPHPHLLCFITHQAQQVVLVLSDLQESALGPVQAVLLFQRCRLLLACLQHSSLLAQHLRSHMREEFRYLVKTPCAAEKLPPRYPISGQTAREVELLLTLLR